MPLNNSKEIQNENWHLMKLGIIGSRSFSDYTLLFKEVSKFENITLIISGGAVGADLLGERYAKEHKIPTRIFYPDWNRFGKRAGFLRNLDIVRNSDHIIVFWNGISRGSQDSINKAKELNIPVTVILFGDK